jgi:hypothetical protein
MGAKREMSQGERVVRGENSGCSEPKRRSMSRRKQKKKAKEKNFPQIRNSH